MLVHEVVTRKLAAAYLARVILHIEIQESHLPLLPLEFGALGSRWLVLRRQKMASRVLSVAVLRLEAESAVAASVAAVSRLYTDDVDLGAAVGTAVLVVLDGDVVVLHALSDDGVLLRMARRGRGPRIVLVEDPMKPDGTVATGDVIDHPV